jgi:hypothetical protein
MDGIDQPESNKGGFICLQETCECVIDCVNDQLLWMKGIFWEENIPLGSQEIPFSQGTTILNLL